MNDRDRTREESLMAGRSPDRPNVLFILTDDQGCWAMGCAGNRELRTPNLDRLAASGTRFTDFFCVSPVCSPARASILTGRIPSRHGVHDWIRAGNSTAERDRGGVLLRYLEGQTGYPEVLAANGYTCGLSGKWHLGDSHHPQMGFTFWEVHATGGGPYYGAPMIRDGAVYEEARYVTDVITDNALRFLDEQAASDRPFYLGVHYTAPHTPWAREQHPTVVYDDYFRNCAFNSVPNEPLHPRQVRTCEIGRDDDSRRRCLSGYFTAVTEMDRNVGRLLDRLEKSGLRQNTLVFFSGDNGMNTGHHGVWGKGNGTYPLNMFDTSVKVPAIVSRPGHVPEGRVCDALLSHYDLLPTLLDYLRLPAVAADGLPGRSFASLLRGDAQTRRESIVVFDEYGPVRMIRTRDWKYVHRYPDGPHELFDLRKDPDERYNRAGDRAAAAVARDMRSDLARWFERYADPQLDGTREPVAGSGQLGLVGPRRSAEPAFAEPPALVTGGE